MITIRKNVKDPSLVEEGLDKTLAWMRKKYPHTNFDNVDFIFSYAGCRSRYYRNEHNEKYPSPVCYIAMHRLLRLYDMKSLKLASTQVFTGRRIQTQCALVHELTHHMQAENGLGYGELLTTQNELEYLEKESPVHFKVLTQKLS